MKSFRELVQEKKLSAEDSYDALVNAMNKGDSKFDQAFWEFLEVETADSGIYAGDATPDDLLDALDDKQLQKAYTEFSKKFKKLFESKVINEKSSVKVDKDGDENITINFSIKGAEIEFFIQNEEKGDEVTISLNGKKVDVDYDDLMKLTGAMYKYIGV